MTTKLRISNCPPGIFPEADLVPSFKDAFSAYWPIQSIIGGYYETDSADIVLEFTDCNEAVQCASLNMMLDVLGAVLELKVDAVFEEPGPVPVPETSNILEERVSELGYSLEACVTSFEDVAQLAAAKEGVRATGKAQVDWHPQEVRHFVQELLWHRERIQTTWPGLPKQFLTELSNALWLKNVNFSNEQCLSKKNAMDSWFRKVHKNTAKPIMWEHYLPWCLITKQEPRQDSLAAPQKGSNTRSDQRWRGRANLLLIEEYSKRKERFAKPNGFSDFPDSLWTEVATVLESKNMTFSASDCKKQWDALQSDFKRAYDQSRRSGEGAVTFEYFDKFLDIFKDSVTIEPEVVVSVGAGSSMVFNGSLVDKDHIAHTTPSRKRPPGNSSMESPGSAKRPLSRMEMQRLHIENQAKLVNEFSLLRQCISEKTDVLRDLTSAILNSRNRP